MNNHLSLYILTMETEVPIFDIVPGGDNFINEISAVFMDKSKDARPAEVFTPVVYNTLENPLFTSLYIEKILGKTNLRQNITDKNGYVEYVDYMWGKIRILSKNKITGEPYTKLQRVMLFTRSGLTLCIIQSRGEYSNFFRRFITNICDELAEKRVVTMETALNHMKNEVEEHASKVEYWKSKVKEAESRTKEVEYALDDHKQNANIVIASMANELNMCKDSEEDLPANKLKIDTLIKEHFMKKMVIYLVKCPPAPKTKKKINKKQDFPEEDHPNRVVFDAEYFNKLYPDHVESKDEDDISYDLDDFMMGEMPDRECEYYYSIRVARDSKEPKEPKENNERAPIIRSVVIAPFYIVNQTHANLVKEAMKKYATDRVNIYRISLEMIEAIANNTIIKNVDEIFKSIKRDKASSKGI